MWPAIFLLLGAACLWFAFISFRESKRRTGDFSEWMVSDSTRLNRWLWIVNVWTRMIALFAIGAFFVVVALWEIVKHQTELVP